MKKLTLTLLLALPLAVLCFKPMKKPRPKFDRLANECRILKIKEMIWEAKNRGVSMGRLPSPYPKGYPSDPDSGSWEGQP